MFRAPHRLAVAILAAVLPALAPILARAADTVGDCRIGAYRLADGSLVDIGASDGEALRWRRFDGTVGALHKGADGVWTSTLGWTDRPDGKTVAFSECAVGDITFDKVSGHRIAFDVTDTAFDGDGDGVRLAGRLVMPKAGGRVPIVVLIHGSEDFSARDFYALQRLLPAEGIGVFVYDKRGTGASGGKYSQDFSLLAGPRAGRVGYQGGSEGGWVAPLAASRAPVDFVIVGFGLAVSVLEEDRSEAILEMRLKGHGPAEIAKALEITDAAEAVMASGSAQDFARFDAVRAQYRAEPWYKDVHGNFTWMLLPYDEAALREKGKAMQWGTPWRYDPMPTLSTVKAPQLWILGQEDLQAPSAETGRRLETLAARGQPITLAMVPRAEHGIYEFETRPDGERVDTRNPDGYFAMLRDFARDGRLSGPYGDAVVTPPPANPPK